MSCSASKVAGKTPIGVVSYINSNKKLAISLVSPSRMSWSDSSADISGIANWASESAARTDFDGKNNMAAWVRYFGSCVTNYAPDIVIITVCPVLSKEIGIFQRLEKCMFPALRIIRLRKKVGMQLAVLRFIMTGIIGRLRNTIPVWQLGMLPLI